jgi:hypothetical protein
MIFLQFLWKWNKYFWVFLRSDNWVSHQCRWLCSSTWMRLSTWMKLTTCEAERYIVQQKIEQYHEWNFHHIDGHSTIVDENDDFDSIAMHEKFSHGWNPMEWYDYMNEIQHGSQIGPWMKTRSCGWTWQHEWNWPRGWIFGQYCMNFITCMILEHESNWITWMKII